MKYPRVKVKLEKIKQNTQTLVNLCKSKNITVMGVTKVFCAIPEIANSLLVGGVDYLADSRIENLIKLQNYNLPKVLLRIPMLTQAEEVVKYSDISLNSEIETIKELSKFAQKHNKKHNIILMFDLGDLREGIFFEENYLDLVSQIIKFKNINLIGIGTNLTCYGGIVPNEIHFNQLLEIKQNIEQKNKIKIDIISAGNSSSLHLLDKEVPNYINNIRLGESIVLGRETAFGNRITNTYDDAFILEAEVIESSLKPSHPIGEIGMDAFGGKPKFIDNGRINRIIVGIGRQDVEPCGIIPIDEKLKILGGSSDHIIIDCTNSKKTYKVGDIISFKLEYGSLLSLMTSPYVNKIFY